MMARLCRFCATPVCRPFVDLGRMPLANAYRTREQLDLPEACYPLRAFVCENCWLVQADAFVLPKDIFHNYAYFSSYSDSWVEHARRFTLAASERFRLGSKSQVLEIASNDGYLLQHFVAQGIPVLGIEPAENVAEAARCRGVPTEVRFFGREAALNLVSRGLAADLVVGNNVLAHVPDINDFVGGLALALKPDGVVSLEFPHLLRLIEEVQFDTIYHEHFYYLSLLAVETVLAAHGLRVFDIEELPTHGGSLRVMACLARSNAHLEKPTIAKVRADEAAAGFDSVEIYDAFQARVIPIRDHLMAFLHQAHGAGRSVAAYGAAAKGNTLLNFSGIGTDLIPFVVDRSLAKQGHFMPGNHIPILPPDKIAETRPDYVLILPWNVRDEIVETMSHIREWGGSFVVAVPELRVLP